MYLDPVPNSVDSVYTLGTSLSELIEARDNGKRVNYIYYP
jgi:hypothetical protein